MLGKLIRMMGLIACKHFEPLHDVCEESALQQQWGGSLLLGMLFGGALLIAFSFADASRPMSILH